MTDEWRIKELTELRKIATQRDELLAACKVALSYVESVSDDELAQADAKIIRATIERANQ